GQGYAFEAASALRDWAFSVRGLPSLVSYCDPENARSIGLARKLGAVPDASAVGQDPEDLVFRHRPGLRIPAAPEHGILPGAATAPNRLPAWSCGRTEKGLAPFPLRQVA